MTLLELTVVILVLLSLVSILFLGARAWKKGSDRSCCVMNIRNTQQAVRAYQNMYQIPTGAALELEGTVIGPGKFIERPPRCPSGGEYEPAGVMPPQGSLAISCNLASSQGHNPPVNSDW